MATLAAIVTCAGLLVLVTAPSAELTARSFATSAAPPRSPVPLIQPAAAAQPSPCPDPMAIVKSLYDANDAAQFDASLRFFTEDASLITWAEGVNGYHARERHMTGKAEIRGALTDPGLRRASSLPDGPIYHETQAKVSGNRLTFRLEPDRVRANGKPYNPFRVEVIFVECKIKQMTVIDLVTWL